MKKTKDASRTQNFCFVSYLRPTKGFAPFKKALGHSAQVGCKTESRAKPLSAQKVASRSW